MTATVATPAPTPPPPKPGFKALLTPSWLGIAALVLVFTGACWFILAPWQFGRHTERDAQNAQIEAALSAPTVPVTDLLSTTAEPAASSEWRTVTATGSFLPDQQAYVRLRQLYGQDAREIVVPFVLTDGTRILVDRGYQLSSDLSAGQLPTAVPTGQVTLIGRVSADQPDPSNRPDQNINGRREVYGINSASLLGAGPGARVGFIQLTSASPAVLTEIGVPDRDDGPFLSYALQWVVFGTVALLAIGFFAYREAVDPFDGDPYRVKGEGTAPVPAPRPQKKRYRKSDLYD